MTDNPQLPGSPPFRLPDLHVVTLEGRDATAFAQAQLMSDVAALAPGHWQWSGWLTPKGRVIALAAVLARDAEHLVLLLADADPATFVAALQRFVFRSKVVIRHRDDLVVSGTFAPPVAARDAAFVADGDAVELDLGGAGGPRTVHVSPGPVADDADALAAWRADDLRHGLPRLGEGQFGQWTPQQLSLDRLRAYSVKKGCYPGQEIVARTHFLGQAKRGLALLDGAVAPGAPVTGDDGASGTVVASDGGLALAVLPLAGGPALAVEGRPVPRLTLLDGLAR